MCLLAFRYSAGFNRPRAKARCGRAAPTGHVCAQVQRCATELQPQFAEVDGLVGANLRRVQRAFRAARVAPHHFAGSTGYGHGDLGRATLDQARLVSNCQGDAQQDTGVSPHTRSATERRRACTGPRMSGTEAGRLGVWLAATHADPSGCTDAQGTAPKPASLRRASPGTSAQNRERVRQRS